MVRKKIYFIISIISVLVLPLSASAASIGVVVPESFYPTGSLLMAKVLINSTDQDINAAFAQLNFPADKLSVVSIETDQSIFNVWPEKPFFSNELGTIRMEGVAIGEGWIGSEGEMAEIIFKVKAAGEAKITITSSAVLASDGEGTNVLDSINNSAVALGLSDTETYLVIKAEEVNSAKEIGESSVFSNEKNVIPPEQPFWNGQVSLAYAVFLVLVVIIVNLWAVVRLKNRNPNIKIGVWEETISAIKLLEEKEKKSDLSPEESKILSDLRDRIVKEYEKLASKK